MNPEFIICIKFLPPTSPQPEVIDFKVQSNTTIEQLVQQLIDKGHMMKSDWLAKKGTQQFLPLNTTMKDHQIIKGAVLEVIRFSGTKLPFVDNAPKRKITRRGLNICGRCNNNCQISGKRVVQPLSYGNFKMNKQDLRCPECKNKVEIDMVIFVGCDWEIFSQNPQGLKGTQRDFQQGDSFTKAQLGDWNNIEITTNKLYS